jgi:Na+-driven multidrug efflux pump
MTLQSTGQKGWATLLALTRSGLYFIPLLYIFSMTLGAFGIQIAQPVADILSFSTALPIIVHFLKKLPADE